MTVTRSEHFRQQAADCRLMARLAATDLERRLALALAKDFEANAAIEERAVTVSAICASTNRADDPHSPQAGTLPHHDRGLFIG